MKWNKKIAIITHLIFWSLVFSFSVGITSQFFPIRKAIPFSCLSLMIYCCIAYFNGLFIIPRFFKTGKFGIYFLLVGLSLTVAIALNIFFLNWFIGEFSLKTIFQQGSTIIEKELDIQRLRIAPAFFTTTVILFISTVYKLVFSFLEKEQFSMQLQNEKIQHELQFLRSQISPHFLFNALNNLHSIVQLNPQHAGDFILKLGEMLRFVLYECQNKMVSISAEIKYIEHFVFFQKEKDSRRQQISFTKKGSDFAVFKLEPMLLIPIVENAFQYNHSDNPEQYFVHIHLELNEESLIFLVENNLSDEAKPTSEKELKNGIGLKNVTRRLELLYPQKHQLKHGVENGKYKVRLVIQRVSNDN